MSVTRRSKAAKKARATHKAVQSTRARNKILKAGARPKLRITKRDAKKLVQKAKQESGGVRSFARSVQALASGNYTEERHEPGHSFASVNASLDKVIEDVKRISGLPDLREVKERIGVNHEPKEPKNVYEWGIMNGRRPPEDAA